MSRTHRALGMLVLCLTLFGATTAVAAAAPPVPSAIEDQNDRLLRNIEAGAAERTQAAVQLVRSMERNLVPVAAVDGSGTRLAPRADTIVAQPDGNVLATLLLGLVGGLVGGAAVMSGWTAISRRRPHRAAPAS